MSRYLRECAVYIALMALVMRAVIPVGWMPNSTGKGAAFIVCTADGPAPFLFGPDGKPAKQDDPGKTDHHSTCPFNAAPHFAVHAALASVDVPASNAAQQPNLVGAPFALGSKRYQRWSPRAPPFPV